MSFLKYQQEQKSAAPSVDLSSQEPTGRWFIAQHNGLIVEKDDGFRDFNLALFEHIDDLCPLYAHIPQNGGKSALIMHLLQTKRDVLPILVDGADHFARFKLSNEARADKTIKVFVRELSPDCSFWPKLQSHQSEIEAAFSKVPTKYDFRTPLEGNTDSQLIQMVRKVVSPTLATAEEFLKQNLYQKEVLGYWVNFFLKPTNPVLKMVYRLCSRFDNNQVAFINLVLLRIFFPPLFSSGQKSDREQFKDLLKVVYDRLTGLSLCEELKHRNWENIFNLLFGVISTADRNYGIKTYHNCFVSTEIVTWLTDNMEFKNRADAVELCAALQQAGYMEHMADHKRSFKDKYAFWRWTKAPGAYGPLEPKKSSQNFGAFKEMFLLKRPFHELIHFESPERKREMLGPATSPKPIQAASAEAISTQQEKKPSELANSLNSPMKSPQTREPLFQSDDSQLRSHNTKKNELERSDSLDSSTGGSRDRSMTLPNRPSDFPIPLEAQEPQLKKVFVRTTKGGVLRGQGSFLESPASSSSESNQNSRETISDTFFPAIRLSNYVKLRVVKILTVDSSNEVKPVPMPEGLKTDILGSVGPKVLEIETRDTPHLIFILETGDTIVFKNKTLLEII